MPRGRNVTITHGRRGSAGRGSGRARRRGGAVGYSRAPRESRRGGAPIVVAMTDADYGTAYAGRADQLARAVWRYRSELAPVGVGFSLWAAGAWTHAAHPGWWPWMLGASGAAVTALWRFGEYLTLDRRIERLYVASAAAAGALWLAASDAFGAASPMPQILGVGVVLCGIPWWAHRRRRAKVQITRKIEAWPIMAESCGLPGSKIVSVLVHAWGVVFRIKLRPGQHHEHVATNIRAIESVWGSRLNAATSEPDLASARHAFVRIVERDPHAEPIPHPLPEPGSMSGIDPWPMGLLTDAREVTATTRERHFVAIGQSGAGKSALLEGFLACYATSRDQVLLGIDLAGGATLETWRAAFVPGGLATTPHTAVALLEKILDGIAYREGLLARLKADAARTGKPIPDSLEPSPQLPSVRVVIDEFADLLAAIPGAEVVLGRIGKRGRKVGYWLFILSQNGSVDELGSSEFRAQFKGIIGLRVRGPEEARLVFGKDATRTGWQPERITTDGGFLLRDPEHHVPQVAKGYYLDAAARAKCFAALDAAGTAQLDDGTAAAMGLDSRRATDDRRGFEPISDDWDEDDDVIDAEVVGDHDDAGQPIPDPSRDSVQLIAELLDQAGAEGLRIPELLIRTGLAKTRLYEILSTLAESGAVERAARGRWRSTRHGQPAA